MLGTAVLALLPLTGCGSDPGGTVALIGDSITDLSRQPLTDALGTDHRVEIVGKFGARSDQVVEETKVIAASKPNAVIINVGTNDALQQVPPEQSGTVLQQLLDETDGVGCRYLVHIGEGITDIATGASRTAEAEALNERIDEVAERNDVGVIRWNDVVADHGGTDELTFDSVHLSEKGIVLLAQAYGDALDDC